MQRGAGGVRPRTVPAAARLPLADPLIPPIPYTFLLVNVAAFFQELYGGLGLCSEEQFEAANAANKGLHLHHVPKGGGRGAQQSSAIKMAQRALETDSALRLEHSCRQRRLQRHASRRSAESDSEGGSESDDE